MKATVMKTILCLGIGLLSIPVFGQDILEAYQEAIDKVFSGIPSEKVTTGILIERAPAFVDMSRYEGNKEIMDTCNVRKWKQMVLQLNIAHLDSRKFNYDNHIVEADYSEKVKTGDIPLGIIFYDYNRIDPEALSKGRLLIDETNGVVRDISSRNESSLKTVTCFAVSPMAEILQAGTYSFYLEPSLFISNKTQSPDEISIDLGDGKGFVLLPAHGKASVHFDKPGIHTLTLKAVQKELTYLSYATIYVQKSNPLLHTRALGIDPERNPDVTVDFPWAGIDAEYGIWYRCNHDNTLRKPFLIVSGFDPGDANRVWEIDDDGNKKDEKLYLYHVANKDSMLDRLRENGYDIIAYRSRDSKKSVVDNAMNLVELIQTINTLKTSNNELVVVGASMGGLVARYALTWMEHQNIDHQTRLFVSLDSPQNGANIDLGMQHMIAALSDDFNGIITIVDMLKEAKNQMLGCVAAREMLLYHHTATSGQTAQCAPERTAFVSNLNAIGNFPQKCQSLAISMGSGTATGQGFSAGQTLLKKNPSIIGDAFFLSTAMAVLLAEALSGGLVPFGTHTLVLAGTQLSWEFEVRAVPNQSGSMIFHEDIKLRPCIPPPTLIGPPVCFSLATLKSKTVTVNNTLPVDNAPGSTRGLHNMTDFFDNQDLMSVLAFFGALITEPNRDCFIPAYSALGLSVAPHTHLKNYLNANMVKMNNNDRFYRNYNKATSPFDYLYIEEPNMYHIADANNNSALTSSMIEIMNEFLIPSHLELGDRVIHSGQAVDYEAPGTVTVTDFVVEPGGHLDIKARHITLGPGFSAQAGSTVRISADTSWICPAGSIQSVSFSPLSSLVLEDALETQEQTEILPVEPKTENEVHCYPNPVENILNMKILSGIEGPIKITIVNTLGQTVHTQSVMNDANNSIDFSKFDKGLYFVNVIFANEVKTVKIIKK